MFHDINWDIVQELVQWGLIFFLLVVSAWNSK
jgi:hypothetical protein